MTSQDHRDYALALLPKDPVVARDQTRSERYQIAQVYATIALYEGLYELLGDDSNVDRIKVALYAIENRI